MALLAVAKAFLGAGVGNLASGVTKVVGAFKVNKENQAQRDSTALARADDLTTSAQAQFSKEFHTPTNIFDSLINAIESDYRGPLLH